MSRRLPPQRNTGAALKGSIDHDTHKTKVGRANVFHEHSDEDEPKSPKSPQSDGALKFKLEKITAERDLLKVTRLTDKNADAVRFVGALIGLLWLQVDKDNLSKEVARMKENAAGADKRGDKIKAVTKQVHAFKEEIDSAQ